MSWNKERIDSVAVQSAAADYAAFEAIGLDALEDGRVLDVGCFDGYNTVLKFRPYGNLAAVVGVDPDAAALEQAGAQTDDARFAWRQGSAEDCDEPAESFDLVYFSHSFQHVRDKELAARNAWRMLKPGGHIVIKATDDSCKLSYPDPDHVMKRLFKLYEDEIIHRVEHTRYTDRNSGQKLYWYLKQAGFEDIRIDIRTTDTAGKTAAERRDLFDRFTYFRKKTPEGVSEEVAKEQRDLLAQWERLFLQDEYYHVSNTFVATARKPGEEVGIELAADKVGEAVELDLEAEGALTLSPMREVDLGEVMAIEIDAFPDPWTPLAYAMEIRHNKRAHYIVARDAQGELCGFNGWWVNGDGTATIMHIATAPAKRRMGVGRELLGCACRNAAAAGCSAMTLSVRAQNAGARAFYLSQGFAEAQVYERYYTAPTDDAIFMVKPLT